MNIDELTYGEIKRIVAEFGDKPASPAPVSVVSCAAGDLPNRTLCEDRIGRVVLIRTYAAGVWIGTLIGRSVSAAGHSAALTGARRIWSWRGASECSQLAITGPREGKIGTSCAPVIHGVIEEFAASDACIAAVAVIPEWRS